MNTIELAAAFQKELDKRMVSDSTTGWMELNSNLVQYNGGAYIKIPDITMDGLADYDRGKGFTDGDIVLKFQLHTMTQDRGRSFMLDAMDVNESNFVATAGAVMKEFQDTMVIPEIDAYRYSKIASLAMENNRASYGYEPDESTIFKQLTDDITMVQDKIGTNKKVIVTMSIATANILYNNEKISKSLNTMEFKQGEMTTRIKFINDVPIVTAPSDWLKTAYNFYSGVDEEAKGGFEIGETAKTINWIIAAENAPIAVSKQDIMRIFEPDKNINADAYKINYRRYHDLWIPKNKMQSVWVNIREQED